MSDEFESHSENNYSPFWPLLILLGGLLAWFAIQDYLLNNQRSAYDKQFHDQQFLNVVGQADAISTRYVGLVKDLLEAAGKEGKDSVPAKILNDAIAAGLLQVKQNPATNSTANPAPPASTSTPAPNK